MPRLRGLDHVGLVVTDMDKALDFYQRLGFAVVRRSGPNDDGTGSAVMRVGVQELNLFSRPGLVADRAAPSVGLDHFCLVVDAASIDDVVADLRAAGIAIAKGPERRRDGAAVFVHDQDGVRVELQLKAPAV